MNITSHPYFAHLDTGPYLLEDHITGGFTCRMNEGQVIYQDPVKGPRTLYLMFEEDEPSTYSNMDVYEVLNVNGIDYICPVSDRSLNRPTANDPWHQFGEQDYASPCPMIPTLLNIGDVGSVHSAGRWSWFDDKGNTGAGDLDYTNSWEVSFGRITHLEVWNQRADGEVWPAVPVYQRHHAFDLTTGRMGFRDLVTGELVVTQAWVGQ